jgi:mono/diheme cytochrome c family protein
MTKKFILCWLFSLTICSAYGLTGEAIYKQTCTVCHGANGQGTVPGAANFTDKKGILNKPDNVLLEHIIKGYQSPGSAMAMPPRGGNPKLTDDDLKNVLAYIRQTFGQNK